MDVLPDTVGFIPHMCIGNRDEGCDVMVHAVLSDVAEATGFLRVICPPPSCRAPHEGGGQITRDTKDVITR
jgi:hypothetical protein